MIALSYIWLLALIPLLVEKDDREVQWHAKHGIVLMVAEIILWIAITIVNLVITAIFAPLGCIFTILSLVLFVAILILHVMCIVKGINGQRLTLPMISEYADRF